MQNDDTNQTLHVYYTSTNSIENILALCLIVLIICVLIGKCYQHVNHSNNMRSYGYMKI